MKAPSPLRIRWIAGLLTIVSLAFVGCERGKGDAVPDSDGAQAVVLITVDGLVADDLAMFGGSVNTPNLAGLAQAGIAWRDVWTVSPLTRPAVATYLTGSVPGRHGVRDDLLSSLSPGMPTLAGLFAEQGFRTVAFPDASTLGPSSGLLGGFETIDDPPRLSVGPITWMPEIKSPGEIATDFAAYVKTLPKADRFFAWIHLSGPLNSQVLFEIGHKKFLDTIADDEKRPRPEDAIERVDQALGKIVSALGERGILDRSAVVVVATSGDVRGGEGELPGPGYSLHERAIRVPLIARLPGGTKGPDQTRPLWAPDVSVSVARLGGAEFEQTEGVDIFDAAPADRVLLAWSAAPRDQLGWQSLCAARTGSAKRVEGFTTRTFSLESGEGQVRPEDDQRLAKALADAGTPPAPAVPWESIRKFVEARGIRTDAVTEEGRRLEPAKLRDEVVGRIWNARQGIRQQRLETAIKQYTAVLELDGDNLSALLCLGQIKALNGAKDAEEIMARALRLYPDHPEVIHWYSHSIWSGAWADAEPLIVAVQPHMPNQADVLYDLACSRSLAGDLGASEKYLRGSIEAGYRQWDHIEVDSDLRNLRESRRLAAVLREYGR